MSLPRPGVVKQYLLKLCQFIGHEITERCHEEDSVTELLWKRMTCSCFEKNDCGQKSCPKIQGLKYIENLTLKCNRCVENVDIDI